MQIEQTNTQTQTQTHSHATMQQTTKWNYIFSAENAIFFCSKIFSEKLVDFNWYCKMHHCAIWIGNCNRGSVRNQYGWYWVLDIWEED